mmetsp:Transcript_18422/g.51628  ORF Transcript_18422/g.51628 Transcript_18422/m.51628 type:complete len:224 (+) Transcript_18422:281-952(+)
MDVHGTPILVYSLRSCELARGCVFVLPLFCPREGPQSATPPQHQPSSSSSWPSSPWCLKELQPPRPRRHLPASACPSLNSSVPFFPVPFPLPPPSRLLPLQQPPQHPAPLSSSFPLPPPSPALLLQQPPPHPGPPLSSLSSFPLPQSPPPLAPPLPWSSPAHHPPVPGSSSSSSSSRPPYPLPPLPPPPSKLPARRSPILPDPQPSPPQSESSASSPSSSRCH